MFGKSKRIKAYDELLLFIKEGELSKIKSILDAGLDVNIQDHIGCTPLIYACEYQQYEVVKYLVSVGASVMHKEEKGYDAEAVAAWHGEYRMGAYTKTALKIIRFLKECK